MNQNQIFALCVLASTAILFGAWACDRWVKGVRHQRRAKRIRLPKAVFSEKRIRESEYYCGR